RRVADAPHAPGVVALAAFAGLALVTTVPLPPFLLGLLSPATARLYTDALPGWPGDGGWSVWRALAPDPDGVSPAIAGLSGAAGAFAVIVGFPWRAPVVGALVRAIILGGVLFAALGLLAEVAGNGRVLWVTDVSAAPGRASGPFVNPNHLATVLEIALPLALV